MLTPGGHLGSGRWVGQVGRADVQWVEVRDHRETITFKLAVVKECEREPEQMDHMTCATTTIGRSRGLRSGILPLLERIFGNTNHSEYND